MSAELPNGWVLTTLETIAHWGSGGTPSRSKPELYGGTIPWFKTGELGPKEIFNSEETITHDALKASSAKLFPQGSVVVAMYGATIGKVSILGREAATNQACAVGIPMAEVTSSGYLYNYLRSQKEAFVAAGQGGAQPNISQTVIKAWPIPIAPVPEQKRIVYKLDTVLTRVDAVSARLARVAPLLKRFRQSVLAAATSGRLTEDWRGNVHSKEGGLTVVERDARAKEELLRNNPGLAKKKSTTHSKVNENYLFELPDNWCFSTWGQISEWITYGFTRPMPSTDQGQRLLTAKDVHPFKVRLESSGYTTQGAFFDLSEKDKPLFGDLLITKDGSIGRAALIRTTESFCINQSVAVCWLRSTSMDRNFLEIVANADFTQRFVADMAKGMAIQHLSIVDFACCPVPVPPQNEQTEIVRRVETLFAFADRLEARLQAAQTATERLTPAMLAKAFRGELVPQDPNDEPASELLRRLQQEVPSTNAKRGRKSAA